MRRVRVDLLAPDPAVLGEAADIVRAGGVVVSPTDTLYGMTADAFSPAAVQRVFRLKGRQAAQAIPLIACDVEQVARDIGPLTTEARALADRFWPGPLTLLLPVPPQIATEASGGTGLIGVRVPRHQIAVGLCRLAGRPLTATSANLSGQPASSDPDVVERGLAGVSEQIDLMLDAGLTPGGPPSTIVDVSGESPRLVRAGAIAWDVIRACLRAPSQT